MLDSLSSFSAFAVLGVGLVFGLKHATEVDHVVAVSTIVAQHRSVWKSAFVGALWGVGHTAALMLTGALVLALRVAIPARVSSWLEFLVGVMIVALGTSALLRALRHRKELHLHKHTHDGIAHTHLHFHEHETRHSSPPPNSHSHMISRIGLRPVLIGTLHGLAGSGALTLLVLTQIQSPWIGLLYLAVFGIGSVVGMLLMSGLIGLPFALSSKRLTGLHHHLQTSAAVFSIMFGLWYAYESSLTSGLFSSYF